MIELGKRIVVVGVSASGKSTFARKLSEKVHITATHVDAFMWQPGWNYIGDEATVKKLTDISQQESWLVEGYIEKDAYDAIFTRASTIIYLDYPRYVSAWRYMLRSLKHRKIARPELEGSPDTFSFEFLARVWLKKEVYYLNKYLLKMPEQDKILRITSPREAKAFLNSF